MVMQVLLRGLAVSYQRLQCNYLHHLGERWSEKRVIVDNVFELCKVVVIGVCWLVRRELLVS
jgi:hypothetical protein